MERPQCQSCICFCQHYIESKNGTYLAIEFGHCIYGRTKMCRASRNACIHFLLREEAHSESNP